MLWAEVRSIRHNVFSPLQGMGITYWAKVGQYPSETKVTAAYCGSLRENVKRALFQACIWKAALQKVPPELDPREFGWASEGPSGAYFPVSLPSKVEVAPSDILKLINYICSSDRSCSSQRCSCSSAQLACPLFCKCEGSSTCCNPKTVSLVQETEHDMDTDSDTSSDNSDTDMSDSDNC